MQLALGVEMSLEIGGRGVGGHLESLTASFDSHVI